VSVRFPNFLRWQVRELRESGQEVTIEPLFEMPDELIEQWMFLHLSGMMPPGQRSAFNEAASIALDRADKLRSGELAVRDGEQLFVAIAPWGDDTVIDLVFTRGKPATYSRSSGDWVRSFGAGDFEYGHCRMLAVDDRVLGLYDERAGSDRPLTLTDLMLADLVVERPNTRRDD
jgi:hypothetical protein